MPSAAPTPLQDLAATAPRPPSGPPPFEDNDPTKITTKEITSKVSVGEKERSMLNDYILVSTIGRGALSTVKLAQHATSPDYKFVRHKY